MNNINKNNFVWSLLYQAFILSQIIDYIYLATQGAIPYSMHTVLYFKKTMGLIYISVIWLNMSYVITYYHKETSSGGIAGK